MDPQISIWIPSTILKVVYTPLNRVIDFFYEIENETRMWCPLELQFSNSEKRKVVLICAEIISLKFKKKIFWNIRKKKDFFRKKSENLQFANFEKLKFAELMSIFFRYLFVKFAIFEKLSVVLDLKDSYRLPTKKYSTTFRKENAKFGVFSYGDPHCLN